MMPNLFDLEELKKKLPELPWDKKDRIMKAYFLTSKDANLFLLNPKMCDFFEEVVRWLDIYITNE